MSEQNPSQQLTAIVVDDDVDTTNVFREYLEMQNIKILGIGYNGKSAAELYQRFKPDLVFLDVMMPDSDGFYGLGKIKQIDSGAKVIMMTADITDGSNKKLKKLGANAIIYKPFEVSEILTAIMMLTQQEVVQIEM